MVHSPSLAFKYERSNIMENVEDTAREATGKGRENGNGSGRGKLFCKKKITAEYLYQEYAAFIILRCQVRVHSPMMMGNGMEMTS